MGKVQSNEPNDAPCKISCPAGINVPRHNRFISDGKWDEALAVLREKVPFPAVLGRVCTSPCEIKCQERKIKSPVAIRLLHRLVAEKGTVPSEQRLAESAGKSVAIVGSGPAGMTAAYYLAKLGYKVVVFEALSKAGGMMRVGIPDYRLPKDVLEEELNLIQRLGVEIKTNTKVESVDKLIEDGYDAVFVSVGAHKGIKMGIKGEDNDGVIDSISFLRDVNLGKKATLGERVAVIGGGNAAVDAARVSLRLGAKDVTIIYRRSEAEMLANPAEVDEAVHEGVKIQFLTNPLEIRRIDGEIHLLCTRMKLGDLDASGRRKPETIPHSKFRMSVDTVIYAIGELPNVPDQFRLTTDERGLIKVTDTLATVKQGIFAGGDAVRGAGTVINAIVYGRQGAISIDKYLGGKGIIDETLAPEMEAMPEVSFSFSDRAVAPSILINNQHAGITEMEDTLTEGAGIEEARRCLWCDLEPVVADPLKCAMCMSCQLWCSFIYTGAFNPEEAGITIVETGPGIREQTFNDNCIGCSICARYCTYEALKFIKKKGG